MNAIEIPIINPDRDSIENPQVETAVVTPFNIRSLSVVSTIGEASLES